MNYRNFNIISLLALATFIFIDWFYLPLPWLIYLIGILAYISILAYGVVKIDSQFFLPVVIRATVPKNEIAITFDDGPHPEKTDDILDILLEYQTKAAFFCIGEKVDSHPDIVRRIHQEGHIIGNHSFFHGDMFDLQTASKISDELQMTGDAIKDVTGRKPRFFRPPYGVTNPRVAKAVRTGKYVAIGWSLRSLDTVIKNEKKLLRKIMKKIKPGDIVLFHDHSPVIANVLPAILEHVKNIGLKIVRVDELIEEKPYV